MALSRFYSQQSYLLHLRRIRFKDPETGKTLLGEDTCQRHVRHDVFEAFDSPPELAQSGKPPLNLSAAWARGPQNRV